MLNWSDIKNKLLGDGDECANLNERTRKQHLWMGVIAGIVVLFGYLIVSSLASDPKPVKSKEPPKEAVADGVVTHDFTEKNLRSALEASQLREEGMSNRIASMEGRFKGLVQSQEKLKATSDKKIHDIQSMYQERANAKKSDKKINHPEPVKPSWSATHLTRAAVTGKLATPLNTSNSRSNVELYRARFDYPIKTHPGETSGLMRGGLHGSKTLLRTPKNYVPAGTFAKVVLLEGADANASVNGQSDTSGILLRVLDRGTLPNGHKSRLKGCFVLASIYGDISSERGEARLTTISCTRRDGSIFEKKVQGYLSFAGKEGVRGTPVMRNGKILAMAGLSGMLSGVGSALQEASQTQTVSPLGTTSVVSPSKVWQNGAYGGAATAMDHLASYYVKRADQYHPVIEIGSGTIATVIFQKGFSLLSDEEESIKKEEHDKHKISGSHVSKSSEEEVRRLLKQAQKVAKHQHNSSPFTNVN